MDVSLVPAEIAIAMVLVEFAFASVCVFRVERHCSKSELAGAGVVTGWLRMHVRRPWTWLIPNRCRQHCEHCKGLDNLRWCGVAACGITIVWLIGMSL